MYLILDMYLYFVTLILLFTRVHGTAEQMTPVWMCNWNSSISEPIPASPRCDFEKESPVSGISVNITLLDMPSLMLYKDQTACRTYDAICTCHEYIFFNTMSYVFKITSPNNEFCNKAKTEGLTQHVSANCCKDNSNSYYSSAYHIKHDISYAPRTGLWTSSLCSSTWCDQQNCTCPDGSLMYRPKVRDLCPTQEKKKMICEMIKIYNVLKLVCESEKMVLRLKNQIQIGKVCKYSEGNIPIYQTAEGYWVYIEKNQKFVELNLDELKPVTHTWDHHSVSTQEYLALQMGIISEGLFSNVQSLTCKELYTDWLMAKSLENTNPVASARLYLGNTTALAIVQEGSIHHTLCTKQTQYTVMKGNYSHVPILFNNSLHWIDPYSNLEVPSLYVRVNNQTTVLRENRLVTTNMSQQIKKLLNYSLEYPTDPNIFPQIDQVYAENKKTDYKMGLSDWFRWYKITAYVLGWMTIGILISCGWIISRVVVRGNYIEFQVRPRPENTPLI